MNRRKFKRHNKRLEVKYSDGGGPVGRGFMKDLSEQGLFIQCRKPAPPGSTVDITATLPDGITARLRGTVQRAVKGATSMGQSMNGMGVEVSAYDMVYSYFLREVVGDFQEADLSMYASSLGAPIVETDEPQAPQTSRPSLIPEKPASVVLACSSCGAKNRVPKARFSSMPKCGKCGMFLIA